MRKKGGEKKASMTIECPEGSSSRGIANRNEENKELSIVGPGSLWSVRALADESLKTGFCYSAE